MNEYNLTEIEKKGFDLIRQGYGEEKIAQELKISIDDVRNMLVLFADIELGAPTLKEPKREDPNLRPGEYKNNPLDHAEYNGVTKIGDDYFTEDGEYLDFEDMSGKLTPTQKDVLSLMSGQVDGQPKTIEQIASELGMSTQEIEEIINDINEKTR